MSVFAVSMCKDEVDVIGGTVAHMCDEVDHVIVADNGSTDGTREILKAFPKDKVTVVDDHEVGYHQSRKMSALADLAASRGAEWIVPFDADEIWYAEDRINEVLATCPHDIVTAPIFNHYATSVDPEGLDPFRTMIWRARQPLGLCKVAFRWQPGAIIGQGNHSVSLPKGSAAVSNSLALRHFPYRTADQFVNKARNGAEAYRKTDLPVTEGAHWRQYGDLLDRYGESALQDVYREHFWYLSPIDSGLIPDPAPYLRWRRL